MSKSLQFARASRLLLASWRQANNGAQLLAARVPVLQQGNASSHAGRPSSHFGNQRPSMGFSTASMRQPALVVEEATAARPMLQGRGALMALAGALTLCGMQPAYAAPGDEGPGEVPDEMQEEQEEEAEEEPEEEPEEVPAGPGDLLGEADRDRILSQLHSEDVGLRHFYFGDPDTGTAAFLRDYQQDSVLRVFDDWEHADPAAPVRHPAIALPTGTGKSEIAASVALLSSAACNGKQRPRVLLLSPTTEIRQGHLEACRRQELADTNLVDKLVDVVEFKRTAAAGSVGFARELNAQPDARIVVATIGSVRTLPQNFDTSFFDVVIFDEGHHLEEEGQWYAWFNRFATPRKMLLSATMRRSQGMVRHKTLLYRSYAWAADRELVKRGRLVVVDFESVTIVDTDGRRKTMSGAELAEKISNRAFRSACGASGDVRNAIVKVVLDLLLEQRRKSGTAHVVQLVQHEALHEDKGADDAMNRVLSCIPDTWPYPGGPKCKAVHGLNSAAENKQALQKFAQGALDVVAECGKLTEGYNNPLISVVGFMVPTESDAKFTQAFGRASRIAKADPSKVYYAALGRDEGNAALFEGHPPPKAIRRDDPDDAKEDLADEQVAYAVVASVFGMEHLWGKLGFADHMEEHQVTGAPQGSGAHGSGGSNGGGAPGGQGSSGDTQRRSAGRVTVLVTGAEFDKITCKDMSGVDVEDGPAVNSHDGVQLDEEKLEQLQSMAKRQRTAQDVVQLLDAPIQSAVQQGLISSGVVQTGQQVLSMLQQVFAGQSHGGSNAANGAGPSGVNNGS